MADTTRYVFNFDPTSRQVFVISHGYTIFSTVFEWTGDTKWINKMVELTQLCKVDKPSNTLGCGPMFFDDYCGTSFHLSIENGCIMFNEFRGFIKFSFPLEHCDRESLLNTLREITRFYRSRSEQFKDIEIP
jgi:hypothetical protein